MRSTEKQIDCWHPQINVCPTKHIKEIIWPSFSLCFDISSLLYNTIWIKIKYKGRDLQQFQSRIQIMVGPYIQLIFIGSTKCWHQNVPILVIRSFNYIIQRYKVIQFNISSNTPVSYQSDGNQNGLQTSILILTNIHAKLV